MNIGDEESLNIVTNEFNSDHGRLEHCVSLFFKNNVGTITWNKIIHALGNACDPRLVVLAKVIAWRMHINFYRAVLMERPTHTVPQNHHKINDISELNNALIDFKRSHEYYDIADFCAALNVDLTTIANLNCDIKWQFCIHDYFHYGIGTWEDVMKGLASSPLNDVVIAKRIGRDHGINYYTAVGQDQPIHSSNPNHHKIQRENITDLKNAVMTYIPYTDWEVLCRSLNVDKQTLTDLSRRWMDDDSDKWQFCLNDYLEYGVATWENIVRTLASKFGHVVQAKNLARKYDIDFYAIMGWNNPASNLVQPDHHKIEKFDDLTATLSKNIRHEAWKTLCRQLKVDEPTLKDLEQHYKFKTDTGKWKTCLRDFFVYGEATWERVIQAVASDPLNQVALGEHIAEKHSINYQEVMKGHVKDEL